MGIGFGVKEGVYSYMVCSSQLLALRSMASVCRGLGEGNLTRTSDKNCWWVAPEGEEKELNEQRQGENAHS